MAKSRRHKNKQPAVTTRKGGGKPPASDHDGAPVDEQVLEAGSFQVAMGDEAGLDDSSDAGAGESVFSQDEASTVDAQILAAEIAMETVGSGAADVAAPADAPDDSVAGSDAESELVEAAEQVAPVDTSVEVVASAPAAEASDRGGRRRGKLHMKQAAKHASVAEPEIVGEQVVDLVVEMVTPTSPRAPAMLQLSEYERLSLAHVAGTPQQSDAPGHWRGVAFRLGSHRLAAAFDEVVEILSLPQITHVPGAQPWMLGVANVRGTLLPVVDLKQFLEGERTVIHEAQRILVVRQSGGDVAVMIDELYGQRSFNDSQIVALEEEEAERYSYFVKQMYRVGGFDWGVFSMSMLTRTPEFRQAAA